EILNSLLQVQDGQSSEAVESRFVEFVRETLSRAKSIEDPLQVAHAIIRSVGRRTSDTGLEQGFAGERERRSSSTGVINHAPTAEQSSTHMALMRAWRVFLEALAEQQPLIIVIDDLQWADEALLDLLEYLTDRLTDVPILFICPARPDFFERRRDWGGGQRNFTTLALEVLSQDRK